MQIDGRKIADEILSQLRDKIKADLHMAAILVGDNPGLKKFVAIKRAAAEKVGIEFSIFEFPVDIQETELTNAIKEIVTKDELAGILIELPLPQGFETRKILNLIPPIKDVDVLSDAAQNSFYSNNSITLPPTVEAVKILFENLGYLVQGKTASVFGRGLLVGKPIAHWLERQGAIVNRIDEFTENAGEISRSADIIISGIGKPHFIKPDMLSDGAVVIDFGYENKEGKMVGDIDPAVSRKASIFTPVPGGMGPITIAAMLKNLATLTK